MTIVWKTLAELLLKSVVEKMKFHALRRASSNVEKSKGYFCDISILHNHMHSLWQICRPADTFQNLDRI